LAERTWFDPATRCFDNGPALRISDCRPTRRSLMAATE
jgi:hypothetical protein